MSGWQCWKWLSITLPPHQPLVPGQCPEMLHAGRDGACWTTTLYISLGPPAVVFNYILRDMGHSGLRLSRNVALMGLSSAIWDSPSGNFIRAWQFGRCTELLKYLWKHSMGSWIIITFTTLPHFNHDILACKENFNTAAHYSFLGKSDGCRNPKSQCLLPAWC